MSSEQYISNGESVLVESDSDYSDELNDSGSETDGTLFLSFSAPLYQLALETRPEFFT